MYIQFGGKKMLMVRRLVSSLAVMVLILSVFQVIPHDGMLGSMGSVKADYVGFVSDLRVNDDTAGTEQSAVAMAEYNNEIYLVWHDMRNGDFDIFFSKSVNTGTSWGDGMDNNNDIRVDDTDSNLNYTDNETIQKYPDMAVDSTGNIYVVWQDNREGRGDSDIYFAKSTNGGTSFDVNLRVDHNGTGAFDQLHPCIEIDENDKVYVAWEDDRESKTIVDIYFTRSDDGGANFVSPDVLVDDDTGLNLQKDPELAVKVNGGTTEIYVVWQDERKEKTNFDIYFSKSTDGGATWGDGLDNNNDKVLNDVFEGSQEHPSLTVDASGDLVVVWDDERDLLSKNLYTCRSSDGGDTWSANTNITDVFTKSSDQTHPVVSTFNNYFSVAWIDNRYSISQPDVYFAISNDSGVSFGPFLKVNQGPSDGIAAEPIMILMGANTGYIAWEEKRDDTRGRDIYFAKSTMIKLKAPTLTASAFNPASGKTSTEFHFTVVYTDEENDAPAAGYPKLYLFTNTSGTEPFPGSPFRMYGLTKGPDPLEDWIYTNGETYEKRITLMDEFNYTYYIATKANFGNLTEVRTTLMPGPILDLSEVTFSNAFPDDGSWSDPAWVDCGITVTDVGFAGVEPVKVRYRMTRNGTANFDNWTNRYVTRTLTPTGLNITVRLLFSEGDDNAIQWQGYDKFDNGPTESGIYRIRVDSTPVVFGDAVPDPNQNIWYNEELVEVGITVSDPGGSGVNGSTIDYSYSTTGTEGYGAWANIGSTAEGDSVEVKTNITFTNGTNNYVRFRAYDALGNGPAQSLDYQVSIDTTLDDISVNHPPTPPEGILPKKTMDRTPRITWNASSDEDDDTISYWIMIGTSVNGSDILSWTDLGGDKFYQARSNMKLGKYFVHVRSYDGHDYSAVTMAEMEITTEGNTPPTPPTELNPLFTDERRPSFSWSIDILHTHPLT
jgi:hypothetical protein